MSNYIKSTNFATKDTLPTGDSGKIVKGTEIDTEFNSIASAISSKADTASPTFTGTPAAVTATAGTNTTQIATTAFVITERTTAGTLTNKTITSPTVSGLSLSDSSIVFEGATADDFETTLTVTDPTADRTITLPDSTGTVALTSDLPTATALFSSTGTYTVSGTSVTITVTAHSRSVDDLVYLNFTSGTAVDGYFTVTTVPDANTFTVTYGSSITTSGNVTGYYSNQGLISLASSEETIVGTNANRAVTPAGVDAVFDNYFEGTKTTDGYQKLPGGLIIQWGYVAAANGTAANFPIAFPTACLNVTLGGQGGAFENIYVSSFTTTTVTIIGGYSPPAYYMAIGY